MFKNMIRGQVGDIVRVMMIMMEGSISSFGNDAADDDDDVRNLKGIEQTEAQIHGTRTPHSSEMRWQSEGNKNNKHFSSQW